MLRTAIGVGGKLGPQRSQSLHAWVARVPDLKVVMPSDAADAKGLMVAVIRDEDPIVFFESRSSYNNKSAVPAGGHAVTLGSAAVKRAGRDLTLVAVGALVITALQVSDALVADGLSIEVVEVRSLVPLMRIRFSSR